MPKMPPKGPADKGAEKKTAPKKEAVKDAPKKEAQAPAKGRTAPAAALSSQYGAPMVRRSGRTTASTRSGFAAPRTETKPRSRPPVNTTRSSAAAYATITSSSNLTGSVGPGDENGGHLRHPRDARISAASEQAHGGKSIPVLGMPG